MRLYRYIYRYIMRLYCISRHLCLMLSLQVSIDGSWRNLTDGYPQLSTADSKYVIIVRIPGFNSSVSYDVSFDPGYVASDKGGGPVGCAKILLPQFYNLLLTSLSLVVAKVIVQASSADEADNGTSRGHPQITTMNFLINQMTMTEQKLEYLYYLQFFVLFFDLRLKSRCLELLKTII